jgi:hypothetical protein
MQAFEERMQRGGSAAIEEASRFFMKTDAVHQTLREITRRLEQLGIPYAVAGGMALVAHGYDRTTVDVDILVTAEGLKVAHEHLDGRGFIPPFEGSRNLRDTQTGVRVEFLVAGRFPGDGKPKPVAFPQPQQVAVEIDGIRYVSLPKLVELKLASGLSHPGRLRDLADVQELIRILNLPREFCDALDPYVRPRFLELHEAVRAGGDPLD